MKASRHREMVVKTKWVNYNSVEIVRWKMTIHYDEGTE